MKNRFKYGHRIGLLRYLIQSFLPWRMEDLGIWGEEMKDPLKKSPVLTDSTNDEEGGLAHGLPALSSLSCRSLVL